MANGNAQAGAASTRPRDGRVADRPGILCGNMLRAVQAYREQLFLLKVLQLMGPCTTQELHSVYQRYKPVGVSTLKGWLTQMRRAGVVTILVVHRNPAVAGMWAVPGQAIPRDAERRTRTIAVDFERRTQPDRRELPRDSWWISGDFASAYRRRWHGNS